MSDYILSFEREVDLSPASLYAGWTERELLLQWFTPKPWKTIDALIEVEIGGAFNTVMQGPDGMQVSGQGCVLDFEKDRRLVWTNAFRKGFMPNMIAEGEFMMVAELNFIPKGDGAIYRAEVRHTDEAGMKAHEAMGFEMGWNAALDQLIELLKSRA